MARSRVKGIGRVRRLMKSLPDSCKATLVQELETAGPPILAKAGSEVLDKTGGLRDALSFKVFPNSMRLQVGLLTKGRNRDFFYGWILDVGRKAKTVRRRSSAGTPHNYRVSPISPGKYDIVGPRTKAFARSILRPALNRAFEKALRRSVTLGGADD